MRKIAILGAGISGLSLGWYLKKNYGPSIQLLFLEKNKRAGGWIETIFQDKFLFELGPRSFRPKGSGIETLKLIEDLNLQDHVIVADPVAHHRYLYQNGALQKAPSSLKEFLFSPLTRKATFPLMREFFRKKMEAEDPSIYDFMSYRFNSQLTEDLIDPINSGVYAGNIHTLSMKSCFPMIYAYENEYGSILKGMLFKKGSHELHSPFIEKLRQESVVSFKGGMQTLTDALFHHFEQSIRLNCEVLSIQQGVIQTTQGKFEVDHIFSTLPSKAVASWFNTPVVENASIAIVNLGYRQKLPLHQGFGYLIASKEKESILGMVWDSCVFPQQNQVSDETRLTVMLGGANFKDFDAFSNQDFLNLALKAVSNHLQVKADPDSFHVKIAKEAIPQYHVGHSNKLKEIERLTPDLISLLGSSYYGVSVNDCIAQASMRAVLPDCKKRTR